MTEGETKSVCLVERKRFWKTKHLGQGLRHLLFTGPAKPDNRLLDP
jgi:hypothetical protein